MKNIPKKQRIGTIHDIKNELKDFLDNIQVDKSEVAFYRNKLKKIKAYNKIVDKKREEIENQIRAGKNVEQNDKILKGELPIEFEVPKSIKSYFGQRMFFKKEKFLKDLNEEETKNKINMHSGKPFDLYIKDGFKSIKLSFEEAKSLLSLPREKVAEKFIEIFKRNVTIAYKNDKKKYKGMDWKKRSKVYDKLFKVLEHNSKIATDKDYNEDLVTTDKDGNVVKSEGRYPIHVEFTSNEIEIYL